MGDRDELTAGPPRVAGAVAVAGAVVMLAGAALGVPTGADLDLALVTDDLHGYLVTAFAHRTRIIAGLCVWVVGALALGTAGAVMVRVGAAAGPLRDITAGVSWLGAGIAVSAFVTWLAVVVQLATGAPGEGDVAIARVAGWYAYRMDGVATSLLIGVGPALQAWAARGWMPRWLRVWAVLALATVVTTFLPYFVPAAPLGMTLLIVPVGIGWTLAAGIVLLGTSSVPPRP